MADAKRNKLADAYAAVRDAARERQRESPGRPKKGQEQIPEVCDDDDADHVVKQPPAPQTRDIRAKAAGTNAKYNGRGQEKVSADRREAIEPKHTRTSRLIAVKGGLQNREKEADL